MHRGEVEIYSPLGWKAVCSSRLTPPCTHGVRRNDDGDDEDEGEEEEDDNSNYHFLSAAYVLLAVLYLILFLSWIVKNHK